MPKMVNIDPQRDEEFARALVYGVPAYIAYAQAYETESTSKENLGRLARRRKAEPHVAALIERLRADKEKADAARSELDVDTRKKTVLTRLQYAQDMGNEGDVYKYLDMLNKMDGTYINVVKDVTPRPYEAMSADELRAALAGGLEGSE